MVFNCEHKFSSLFIFDAVLFVLLIYLIFLVNTPTFEIDESHIEMSKVKIILTKLLFDHRRHDEEPPVRIKRSASQALEASPRNNRLFSLDGKSEGKSPKPSIIEDLRLVRKLGAGTFGAVWKAENTKTGQMVAIKKMIGSSFHEQTKFLKEAEILRMSNHPNVLQFVGLFVKRGAFGEEVAELSDMVDPEVLEPTMSIYLCTEYCRYGDLTKLLSNKDLKIIPWLVRLRLALDIARGLKYLHSKKVVHRDIKGENVLLKPLKRFDGKNIDKIIMKQSIRFKRKQMRTRTRKRKYRGLGLKLGDEDKKSMVSEFPEKGLRKIGSLGNITKTANKMSKLAIKTLTRRKRTDSSVSLTRIGNPRPKRPRVKSDSEDSLQNEDIDMITSTKSTQLMRCSSKSPKRVFPVGSNGQLEERDVDDLEPAAVESYNPDTVAEVSHEIASLKLSETRNADLDDGDGDEYSVNSSDYDSDDSQFDEERYKTKRLANVLHCRAILADVGLARFFKASNEGRKNQIHKQQNNERMTIRGTPWTMAPELISNQGSYTTASDVYSLGIVFLEISTRMAAMQLPRKFDMTPDFDEIDKVDVDPTPTIRRAESQTVPVAITEEMQPRLSKKLSNIAGDHSSKQFSASLERERDKKGYGRARTDVAAHDCNLRKSYADTCPPEFKVLQLKCCDLDPLKRPTAAEIVKDLEHMVHKYRSKGVRSNKLNSV